MCWRFKDYCPRARWPPSVAAICRTFSLTTHSKACTLFCVQHIWIVGLLILPGSCSYENPTQLLFEVVRTHWQILVCTPVKRNEILMWRTNVDALWFVYGSIEMDFEAARHRRRDGSRGGSLSIHNTNTWFSLVDDCWNLNQIWIGGCTRSQHNSFFHSRMLLLCTWMWTWNCSCLFMYFWWCGSDREISRWFVLFDRFWLDLFVACLRLRFLMLARYCFAWISSCCFHLQIGSINWTSHTHTHTH